MELFTLSSRLTMNEWNTLILVANETVRPRNKTSSLFYFVSVLLFNLIFLTNKVVQDLIKPIGLESRAEIKLIVIFFRSDSMTFSS